MQKSLLWRINHAQTLAMTSEYLIENTTLFDGTGAQPVSPCWVWIKEGTIQQIAESEIDVSPSCQRIDGRDKWLTPGFLDTHTHYDAELIVAPSLSESVRHGVTTVLVGSCSLSMVCSDAEDAADIFTRVETVPREKVLPILHDHKHWHGPKQWVKFIRKQPLGPNVVSLLGHSDLRTAVLGLMNATDPRYCPTDSEQRLMESILNEALDAGFLGLSTMCLKWDKVDGDRAWSKSLPSTYAHWREITRFNHILRARGRVHQGAPNAANPLQILQYLRQTIGLWRKPLKTTLISMLDLKGNKTVAPMAKLSAALVNFFGGDFRWQLLPTPFAIYADGMDVVLFEEFGAGEMALDLKDQLERNALLKDQQYRRDFRRFYRDKLSPRVWQRDFADAIILGCPDTSLVGQNFAAIAAKRHVHVVDLFLDLVVEYGRELRWFTVIGNHRPRQLARMLTNPHTLITFSDAGAHIRNMAFYNLPLRFLQRVYQAQLQNTPIMSVARAVHRLTKEQADWLNIDAGHIAVGKRADLVLLDPKGFEQDLCQEHWGSMQGFDLQRMVNRNPGLVTHVMINGQLAVENEHVSPHLGKRSGFGQFLPAI